MTRTEFEQKRKTENLFYKHNYISINEGLIKHHNYRAVLGCTRLSSNGKWCVFESSRGADRDEDFTVFTHQVFGENGESNAFDYLYKLMKQFTRRYNRQNKLVERMSKKEFLERMEDEKITYKNYYISIDEGMLEKKAIDDKNIIGCTRPENGSNWRVYRSDCTTGGPTILGKFKKDEEAAFAFFYNLLTNEDFRHEHGYL